MRFALGLIRRMSDSEIKDFGRSSIQNIMNKQHPTEHGYVHLKFFIGAPGHQIEVCKKVWAKSHNRGKTWVNELIDECKRGVVSTQRPLDVRTIVSPSVLAELTRVSRDHGFKLSKEDKANAKIRDDPDTLAAAAWMKHYFSLCGDCQPNRDLEIHIEPVNKIEIYAQTCRKQDGKK